MSAQLALTVVDPLADVIAWSRDNPDAWAAVVSWAHQDRAAGIAPSTRLYCCLLRRPHFASVLGLRRMPGSPVLVNDHASSGMARLLNRLYPELACPTREARVDGWAAIGGEAS
jgi:hypothetical protein